MNEVTFKPAESVALYASRLIISVSNCDSYDFDIHGAKEGIMPGYSIEGKSLVALLDGLGIDHQSYITREYIGDECSVRRRKLEETQHNILCKGFNMYLSEISGVDIQQVLVYESGNGGLKIKIYLDYGDGSKYTQEMSYFGPYSIRWFIPDQTPQE